MSRSSLPLVLVVLTVLACGVDREAGKRYRAERELWNADWEYRKLSVRPADVGEIQWRRLARTYEAIAKRSALDPSGDAGSEKGQIQILAARALFTAAQVYGGLRDSTRVDSIYERMTRDFGNLPAVASEVCLARGRIAEGRRQYAEAADLYQSAVDRVEPDANDTGVAGVVVDLPLAIARLRLQAAGGPPNASIYAPARAYYERMVRKHQGDPIEYRSQGKLAEIAGDLGDWRTATRELRTLEGKLHQIKSPPTDPANVRFAVADILNRAAVSPGSILGVDIAPSQGNGL